MGNHKHAPVLLVDTGGTLSCHACIDNQRTFDHGSWQVSIWYITISYLIQDTSDSAAIRPVLRSTVLVEDDELVSRSILGGKFVQCFNEV